MHLHQLFSRRNVPPHDKTDFRPDDPKGLSPWAQLRRLSAIRASNNAPAEDIVGCDDAMDAWREYSYRKIFTGTSHEEYIALPANHVDWAIAIHETESDYFKQSRGKYGA